MKTIKIILFPIGDFDTAGNKRLKNLEKYLMKQEGVEVYILKLLAGKSNQSKRNPLFYLSLFLYLFINIFYVSGVLIKQKKKGAINFLYFYEGYNLRFYRIIIAKLAGYKILIDLVENPHSMSYVKSITQKLKLFYFHFFYKAIPYYVTGLVVVSKFLQNLVKKDFTKDIPVFHLPVSFDPDDFNAAVKPYRHPAIFYGGSYGNNYDFDSLFKAFNNIVKEHPSATLYLSGKADESIKQMVKSKIEKNCNVEFLGFLDEELYYTTICNMDILCMPRNNSIQANAGFPFKLAEYLATGKPVIASRVSDVADYITDADAYIYEPGEYKEIEGIINKILSNPQQAGITGNNGKQKAVKYFSAGTATQQFYQYLLTLYRVLIKKTDLSICSI
jgi:glycosyltransferase involved in cell wall biosynthesis